MTACYELDCTDCAFETVVVGTYAEAKAKADTHRADSDAAPAGHFVNVRQVER